MPMSESLATDANRTPVMIVCRRSMRAKELHRDHTLSPYQRKAPSQDTTESARHSLTTTLCPGRCSRCTWSTPIPQVCGGTQILHSQSVVHPVGSSIETIKVACTAGVMKILLTVGRSLLQQQLALKDHQEDVDPMTTRVVWTACMASPMSRSAKRKQHSVAITLAVGQVIVIMPREESKGLEGTTLEDRFDFR